MAQIALIATGVSAAMKGIGAYTQAQSLREQGRYAQKASEIEAEQLRERGKAEFAASQREASEIDRNTDLVLSELQNKAGASGFEATDVGTLSLTGDIAERGELQKQTALATGMDRQAGLNDQANFRQWEGKVAKQNANRAAKASLIGGAASIASSLGMASFSGGKSSTPTGPMNIIPESRRLRYG